MFPNRLEKQTNLPPDGKSNVSIIGDVKLQCTCSKIFKVVCKGTLKMRNKCRSINTTIRVLRLTQIYRIIRNDCQGFNNLSYTIHLR